MSAQTRRRAKRASGSDDAMGVFLRELAHIPLLSAEEERLLGRQVRQGLAAERALAQAPQDLETPERSALMAAVRRGRDAQRSFIEANLRLVVSIARRYASATGLPLADLVQDGNIGLMHAVERFDSEKGFKFSTYATWWIRQAISRGAAKAGRIIHLPESVTEHERIVRRVAEEVERETGQPPTLEMISAESGISMEQLRVLVTAPVCSDSLDRTVNEDDTTLGELVDTGDDDTAAIVDRCAQRDVLDALWQVLDERERRVLELRYGLDRSGDPRTLEEVGAALHLTRERVRQIETRIRSKLRHPSLEVAVDARALVS
jgi:RNA polymerase sigma factor (sigma-70 family)